MTQNFYIDKLRQNGHEVLLPNPDEMDEIHRIIFEELCFGKVLPSSKGFYLCIQSHEK